MTGRRERGAYERALDLLAGRPYSVRELRRRLIRKDVPVAEADAVVERLVAVGLLDDAAYAVAFTRSRLLGSGASSRRIRQELLRRGVAAELADSAIERVVADEEVDLGRVIERVARKKLTSMGDLEPLVLRRRLFAFLVRRGYDLDDVKRVVGELTRAR